MSPVRVRQEALFAAKSFLRRFCLPKPSDSCSLVRFSFHTTSQSGLRPPAPLVGEPLAKPFTLRGLPKPPLVRSNGDDRRQWRKQGGAVGAAASRMQATAKQTLGAATRPWRAKRLRGQARHERTAHAAIGILFVRAILSLRPQIIVSILALSVTFGDTSPRGRGFVRTGKVCKKLQKPLANFPEMRYNTSRGKSAGNRISASLAQSVRAPDC